MKNKKEVKHFEDDHFKDLSFIDKIKEIDEKIKDAKLVDFFENDEDFEEAKKNNPVLISRYGTSSQQIYIAMGQGRDAVSEILIMGPKGGGKSHIAAFDLISSILTLYKHKLRYCVVRLQYGALDDIKDKMKSILKNHLKMKEGEQWKFIGGRDLKFVFPNGSEIWLRAVPNFDKYQQLIHGQEFQRFLFDEISLYANLEVYKLCSTCLRYTAQSEDLDVMDVPLVMRATSNPWSIGIEEVEKYFLLDGEDGSYGKVYEKNIKIMGESIKSTKLTIFSSWIENYKINKQYIAGQIRSMLGDKNKIDAFMRGKINRSDASFFGSVYQSSKVEIKPFIIPERWAKNALMSYDDGTASPFCVLWYVKSDGSPFIDADGEQRIVPAGSTFIIHEFLGCQEEDEMAGLNLTHSQISDRIKDINDNIVINKLNGYRANCGPADTSIHQNTRGKGEPTVATIFENNGLFWKKTKKFGGSRSSHAATIRNMLQSTAENNKTMPHLYFFNDLPYLPKHLLELKRDPSDPEDAFGGLGIKKKDHNYDALRYAIAFKDVGKAFIQ